MAKTDVKMVACDIETAPANVWTFGLFNQFIGIDQIEDDPYILAVSIQWYGKKTVEWYDIRDEQAMFDALFNMLDEADIVVGWNSNRFDVPWIEGELALRGYDRPSPFHKLDLMMHFRKHSRLISKKLAYVSQRFLGDTKVPHAGFRDLWWPLISPKATEKEREAAWARMKKYGKKDTALLFPIFEEVKGWIKLPTPLYHSTDEAVCQMCESTNIQRRGFWVSSAGMRYQKFYCIDCRSWWKSARASGSVSDLRPL